MRKCDSCGKLYQESKDVFCPHCGAVAFKQCNHTSSFDTQKYDRGELYKYNNTKAANSTYTQGAEPHAQRQVVYTQPQKNYNNTQSGSGSFPKINIPNVTKTFTSGKGKFDFSKYIGVIIIAVVIGINMISGLIEGVDYSSDYEVVTEDYSSMGDSFTAVKNASVTLVDADEDFKTFAISIENMYFSIDDIGYMDYVEEQIAQEAIFVEMNVSSFSKARIPEDEFDNAVSDGYNISADDGSRAGYYVFTCELDYNEIACINSGVNIHLANGACVNAELPFAAFSIAEDGSVTYYTSYASDETNWDTVFTECSNEGNVASFSASIDFKEE